MGRARLRKKDRKKKGGSWTRGGVKRADKDFRPAGPAIHPDIEKKYPFIGRQTKAKRADKA